MRIKEQVPEWIKVWAAQKLRAMNGGRIFSDGGMHEDGRPDLSVSAIAREGGSTGGSGVPAQRLLEVYSKTGLEIWRSIERCPEEVRVILFVHHVATGSAKTKARAIGVSPREYWNRVTQAHYFIGGMLRERGAL